MYHLSVMIVHVFLEYIFVFKYKINHGIETHNILLRGDIFLG